jgi:hypothetical protein
VSHKRLCSKNPNRKTTSFQDLAWQKQKGTNQYIKAQALGLPKPEITTQTREKLASAIKARPKKSGSGLRWFRSLCSFKFNVFDYPKGFDLLLVKQYGWYSASNRGGNLNGVSRDHMLSVRFAFDNNIDPELVSHPANCQLLRHNDNVSKLSKCSLTLEELKSRIDKWNNTYGPIA